MTQALEEKLAELERDVATMTSSVTAALSSRDWETVARLAEGIGRCARLRVALGELLAASAGS